MRKLRYLIAALAALSLLAAACGDDGGSSTSKSDTTASACAKTPEKGDPAGKKVGLLFDVTGRGDQSFNDAAACGLDKAAKELKISPTEYPPTNDKDRPDRIKKCATTDNNGLCIGVGFLWTDDIKASATANTKVLFATIDTVVDLPNVTSNVFAEEEGSYLVGAAAALKSKSGKIGFIGGVNNGLIQKFEAGFVAGAKKAKPDIKIDAKYITPDGDFTGFNAPDKAQTIAKGMYADGTDVIYTAAGSSGLGSAKAAKEASTSSKKVWMIGVDKDQYLELGAEFQPYILTSMQKRVDVAVFETIKAYNAGTLKAGTVVWNVKSGGIGYATSGGYVNDIKSKLDGYAKDIADGKITVPNKK